MNEDRKNEDLPMVSSLRRWQSVLCFRQWQRDGCPNSIQRLTRSTRTDAIYLCNCHSCRYKGEPIIGANVIEKGTTNGGITDLDGVSKLNVKPGAILQVSFVGYTTQEVKATSVMKVVLKDDTELLDEVVVVGYGAQKKVNLTGAVANVDVQEAIASRPVTDIAKALQGITPGLSITTNVGGIGVDSNIKLRGATGSLSATEGTSPLILVDNVEVPSLSLVNPDDIASISVLKDAASASIYGTRAAWG